MPFGVELPISDIFHQSYNFCYSYITTLCILKVLIRRAQVPDELPGSYKVNAGQDIMISVYNIHRSSEVFTFCIQICILLL